MESFIKENKDVVVSEYTSPGVIKGIELNIGELDIVLQNEKNCNFKTNISLIYENKKKDVSQILNQKKSDIKEFIKSFLSKQSSEKIKNFHKTDLEIELVNQINNFLNQNLVYFVKRKNNILNCN